MILIFQLVHILPIPILAPYKGIYDRLWGSTLSASINSTPDPKNRKKYRSFMRSNTEQAARTAGDEVSLVIMVTVEKIESTEAISL